MPLSKKKQAEYMKAYRKKTVIPSVIPKQELWEVTDWANYKGEVALLPNCPDGRYRE